MAAASDDPFILALDAADSGTPIPMGLEGLPPKDSEGQPIHYRRVKVAECANWTHRATGQALPITKDRADEWMTNTAKLAAAGVHPFLTTVHPYDDDGNFVAPDARDTLGSVVRLERDGTGVYAIIAVHGDDALKVVARNSRSIGIAKNVRDANGGIVKGEALHHLAIVPNPALPNLGGTTRIAAAADAFEQFARIYQLSSQPQTAAPRRRSFSMSPQLATKAREQFGLSVETTPDDKLDDAVAEKAIALSATVTSLTTERDAAKAAAEKVQKDLDAKAQEVLSLSADAPKRPDGLTLAMYSENIAAKREAAVASGAISEAEAKSIDAILNDASGSPTALALSAAGPAKKPLAFELWGLLAKLSGNGVRIGNTVVRDPAAQAAALALSGGGAGNAAAPMSQERRAELLGTIGLTPVKH